MLLIVITINNVYSITYDITYKLYYIILYFGIFVFDAFCSISLINYKNVLTNQIDKFYDFFDNNDS